MPIVDSYLETYTSRIAIIIPARLSSLRLPHKMLQEVYGTPLIQWTYENAGRAGFPVYIATDYSGITFTENVVIIDEALTGSDRVAKANEILGYDYVINVQGDCPDIHPDDIRALAKYIQKDSNDNKMYTMEYSENPVVYNGEFYRRLDITRHIGIYGFTDEGLCNFHNLPQSEQEIQYSLEQLRGMQVESISARYLPHSIDTKQDLENFRYVVNRFA